MADTSQSTSSGIFEKSLVATAGTSLLSFVLFLVSFGAPEWAHRSVPGADNWSGLWQACGSTQGITVCVSIGTGATVLEGKEVCQCLMFMISCNLYRNPFTISLSSVF